MSAHCCEHEPPPPHLNDKENKRYRVILWIALSVNAAMFAIEIVAGVTANSVSLLADSLDFFGDAANYAISLWVLGMSLHWRAKASLFKAATMLVFGLWVLGGVNN